MERVYLQTYSLGRAMTEDFQGSLKKIAEIGYSGVEFAGGYGDMPAERLKAYLAQLGLDPISSHVSLDAVEGDIPYLAELGARFVICPTTSLESVDACREKAAEFNRLGALAKSAGLRFGYHNHTREFLRFGDKYALELMMEWTDPELVTFQIDVGWATCAGVDVPAFLRAHAGRIGLIHVKETDRVTGFHDPFDPAGFELGEDGVPIMPPALAEKMHAFQLTNCPTGKGIIDWSVIKREADAAGAQGYIVEREYDYKNGDIFGCVAEDLAALKGI